MAQCTTIWSSLVSSFETGDRETGGILGGGVPERHAPLSFFSFLRLPLQEWFFMPQGRYQSVFSTGTVGICPIKLMANVQALWEIPRPRRVTHKAQAAHRLLRLMDYAPLAAVNGSLTFSRPTPFTLIQWLQLTFLFCFLIFFSDCFSQVLLKTRLWL